jgi:hypothetical protein
MRPASCWVEAVQLVKHPTREKVAGLAGVGWGTVSGGRMRNRQNVQHSGYFHAEKQRLKMFLCIMRRSEISAGEMRMEKDDENRGGDTNG